MKFYMRKISGDLVPADEESRLILAELGTETFIECTVKSEDAQRTIQQNRAMHKYFDLLATALNDAGKTMEIVLKHHPNIRWTKESVKGHLWKPVQAGFTEDKENDVSTTELTTVTIQDVYIELHNFLASKYGINVEWPSKL